MASTREVKDELVYVRAAGLDLGKRFLVACTRIPHPDRPGSWLMETERFDTVPAELRRLGQWLLDRRVEVVVLEATSDYWRFLYYTLQDAGLNLMLVNPAHLKGIRGRKSDPSDAAFLARAGASGMVMASFVPGRAIRDLRDLTRRRTEVTVMRGQEIQRLEKELEDTGMKLSSVLTNLVGVTGRTILTALIEGQRDPERLADLAVGRARAKIPALIAALDGTFNEHHAWMCRHYLNQLDSLSAVLTELDARIATLMGSHAEAVDHLDSIPGIGPAAAQVIIAETGGDMNQFPTAGHLASWIGVCPGMNESAGVVKSGRTRVGNSHLKRILGVAAMAAIRNRESYYGVFYRRLAARRGSQRALVAVMHKLAIAIWNVLKTRKPHHDLGADYLPRRDPQRLIRAITRQANAIGLTVRFDPIAQPT